MITDAMTARLKPVQPGRTTLIAVLDIGSTKICCVIARLNPRPEGKALKGRTHTAEVIGFGYGASTGIKSGVITDLDQAEQAIRTVVGMAERAAGLTVQTVVVNVTAGRLGSETFSATVDLGAQEVEKADIQRVLRAVNGRSVRPERSIVHALPIGYAIDGQKGVKDPRGLVGERLSIDVAVISAETLAMRNIELVLNRCHLQIEAMMATPYASGLATLVDDESQLGVACVDFGGATTTVAVFADGHPVYCDALAIGGHHLTLDIARQLSVSVADAERLKTVYGSVLPGQADEREMISIVPVGAGADEAPGHDSPVASHPNPPPARRGNPHRHPRPHAGDGDDGCLRAAIRSHRWGQRTHRAARSCAPDPGAKRAHRPPDGDIGPAGNGARRRFRHGGRHAGLPAGVCPGVRRTQASRQIDRH